MSLNQKQLDTVNNITPRGLMLNKDTPCECGAIHYSTSKHRKFSDTMLYKHKCRECGNKFETWTEG